MNAKTAYWTMMPSIGQLFMNGCSTSTTSLTRSARVDFNQLSTSIFSFVRKHNKEHSPRYIVHGFGEHSPCHSLNVQVFYTYYIIGLDNFSSYFMQKIITLVPDCFVLFCQQPNSLFSIGATLLFPGNTTMKNPEPILTSFVIPVVVNKSAVRGNCKTLQANIYSNRLVDYRKRIRLNLTGKQSVVFPVFSGNAHRFDPALHQSMQANPNFTDSLKVNPGSDQLASISIRNISDRAVLCGSLKSWKTSPFPAFNPVKKCLICPICLPKHMLTGREVCKLTNTIGSNLLQLRCLHVIIDVFFGGLICPHPMFQCSIIQTPGFGQLICNRLNLAICRIQSVFKRFYHSTIIAVNATQSYNIIDYKSNLFVKKNKGCAVVEISNLI